MAEKKIEGIPASDLPRLSAAGNADSVVGVDEATQRAVRFPASGLPMSAAQQQALDEMQEQVDSLNAGSKRYATWADAIADVDNIPLNTGVDIVGDDGTHTDPVSGEIVPNSGRFVMTEDGLEFLSPDALSEKANKSDLDDRIDRGDSSDYVHRVRDREGNVGMGLTKDSKLDIGAVRLGGGVMPIETDVEGTELTIGNVATGLKIRMSDIPGVGFRIIDSTGGVGFQAADGGITGSNMGGGVTPGPDPVSVFDIPSATQEWWISPVHTLLREPYERIVSGSYGEGGEIIVSETINGLGTTRSVVIGSTALVDDHNAPALYAESGRRMLAIWTNHGDDYYLRCRVSGPDGDVLSFLENETVNVSGNGNATYAQIHKIRHLSTAEKDVFWVLFRRVVPGGGAINEWGLKVLEVDQATGALTLGERIPLVQTNQQIYVTSSETYGDRQVLRFAAGFNPSASGNYVHYFELDVESGEVTVPSTPDVVANINGTGLPLLMPDLTPVLPQTPEDTDRRLFYVRPGPATPAIAFAEWPRADPAAAVYHVATLNGDGSWSTRSHGPSGPRIGFIASSNYIAGVSFPSPCVSDVLYVARREGATDYLEEHRVIGGELSVRELERTNAHRISRPISPVGGGGLLTYSAITGYGSNDFTFTGAVRATSK